VSESVIGVLLVGVMTLLGAMTVIANVVTVIAWRWKRRRESLFPLVGGLLAAAGLTALTGSWWGLAPLVVDPGCAMFVGALIAEYRRQAESLPRAVALRRRARG
jgi:hypothetical protein